MQKLLTLVVIMVYSTIGICQTDSFDIGTKASDKATIIGQIYDGESSETIIGAVVGIADLNIYDVTGEVGNFKLEKIPAGSYELSIQFLGYQDYVATINVIGNGKQDFRISSASVNIGEVTVTGKKRDENVSTTIAGVESLSIEKLKSKSKFMGETDVLRSIQSVTGVTSAGEGASGFNVRGGNTDENLILMDGNLLFNPVHALGFFSTFHPDMVENVTLYKGGVPAKYGGRLSSVLDVGLRKGNDQKISGQGGLGLVASRIVLEGPILKDKASFIIGARASYFDYILKLTSNPDLEKSNAFFYDLNAKFDAQLTKTTRVGFTGFTTDDDFRFSDIVKFNYSTTSGSAFIKQLIGDKINVTARVNKGQYESNLFDIKGNNQSQFINKIDYLRGSLSAFYQVADNYNLEFGVGQDRYDMSPGELIPFEESIIKSDLLPKERGIESSAYFSNTLSLGKKFEVVAGVRLARFQNIGPDDVLLYEDGTPRTEFSVIDTLQFSDGQEVVSYSGLEPRLSLRYSITESSSIKLGYNRSFQYLSQISNTASATPVDVWQLSNYHIKPQRADNLSIGYYRNFKDNKIKTYVDFFYREIDNLIDYRDFARLLLNQNIERDLVSGNGRAYGAEFLFNKDYGRHRWEVNYTFSRTQRQIPVLPTQSTVNNGDWYSSNYDKPHNVNINYNFKIKPTRSFSVNFTYSTGRPTTAPISSYTTSNVLTVPVYSDRNQFRIPDYHRMDLAYTIGPWGKKAEWQNTLTFSVYNLYFRKNAFSVFFEQKPFASIKAYRVAVLGSIFPAVTYDFKF